LTIFDEKEKLELMSDEIFVDSKNNESFTNGLFEVFDPSSLSL